MDAPVGDLGDGVMRGATAAQRGELQGDASDESLLGGGLRRKIVMSSLSLPDTTRYPSSYAHIDDTQPLIFCFVCGTYSIWRTRERLEDGELGAFLPHISRGCRDCRSQLFSGTKSSEKSDLVAPFSKTTCIGASKPRPDPGHYAYLPFHGILPDMMFPWMGRKA